MAKTLDVEQASSDNWHYREEFYRRSRLVNKAKYEELMSFFKRNNVANIEDVYIQKYRTKDGWKNYNEQELVDYFLSYIEKIYDYNYCIFTHNKSLLNWYHKHYQCKVCKSLLKHIAQRGYLKKLFETILQDDKLQVILQKFNKTKRQIILSLYNLLDLNTQLYITVWVCSNIFDDFSVGDICSLDQCYSVKQYLSYVLRKRKGRLQNFTEIIKGAINKPNIIINRYFYDMLNFNEYKQNFTKLSTILISDTVYSFLTKEERSKHFEQLLKTATYAKTNIQCIKNAISSRVCKDKEEQNALKSVMFLKSL